MNRTEIWVVRVYTHTSDQSEDPHFSSLFFCDIRPNLDGPVVVHECCMHMFSTTLLVELGWSQLISLCPPAIAPSG